MRLPSSLLLALCLALPSRAAVVRGPPPAAAAPTATLARLLANSLPGLAAVDPLSPLPALLPALLPSAVPLPSPAPALLDARKAAALYFRAAGAGAASGAPASAPAGLQTLEAVNGVLRDFTPQQIRDLPDDQLRALAALILDGAAGRAPRADKTSAVVLAQAALARVEKLKGTDEETVLNRGHNESHSDLIDVRGLPETVSRIDAEGMIFRHYTTKEGLASILSGKSLWNGFLPYIDLARDASHKTYGDLTGIFLTRPDVGGERVGVPAAAAYDRYVDLRLPPGMPVLEVEKGRIYLIPLPGRTRDWLAALYRKWATGGGGDPNYRNGIESIDRGGGPGPQIAVPIEIVGHGRAH